MLGAGFVTRPTLDILSDAGISVTVGKLPFTLSWLLLSLGKASIAGSHALPC